MSEKTAQSNENQPDEFEQDLSPNAMAGQNFGMEGSHPEKDAPTARDIKEIHNQFPELSKDELQQLPVLPEGSRLEQGAVYLDLRAISIGEIKATGDMEAKSHNWYVPKSEVDYQLWNRLIGVTNPERTGQAKDS